jgi:hypothetical protein
MAGPWDSDPVEVAPASGAATPWVTDPVEATVRANAVTPANGIDSLAQLVGRSSMRDKIGNAITSVGDAPGHLLDPGLRDIAANAATFGLAGPAGALGTTAAQKLRDLASGGTSGAFGDTSGAFGDLYQQNLQRDRDRRDVYADQNPGLAALANLAGFATPLKPIAGAAATAPSLLRSMGTNAAIGAGVGGANALSDSTSSDPLTMLKETGKGAAIGAGIGAALPLAVGGAARVVSPAISPNMQTLRDLGVDPTLGRMLGPIGSRVEDAASSIPIVGDFIKSGQFQANQQFNRGVINRALAPIGESLDEATPLGRQAIEEMRTKITSDLDKFKAVPQVATRDPAFDQATQNLIQGTSLPTSLPPDRVAQLGDIIKTKVLDRFDPTTGAISGENFQKAISDLGTEARSLMHFGNDADQRGLGLAVQNAQTELRGLLTRTGAPEHTDAFAANNAAYANMLRVQVAASKQGADEGVFTPAQFSAAVRQLDPTKWHSGFASGNALMQDAADAGKSILGNKVPDSGTPLRLLAASLLGGGVAGPGLMEPATLAATLGGAAGTIGAYSNPGRAMLANILASRPPGAVPLAAGLRQATPVGTVFGAQNLLPAPGGR